MSSAMCGGCKQIRWTEQMLRDVNSPWGWVCQGCTLALDCENAMKAQAQQLGQQGLESGIDKAMRQQSAREWVDEFIGGHEEESGGGCDHHVIIHGDHDLRKCKHCTGLVLSEACLSSAGLAPRMEARDRDGMLLADRLQVLADENVVLLAENARLRRELERSRKR